MGLCEFHGDLSDAGALLPQFGTTRPAGLCSARRCRVTGADPRVGFTAREIGNAVTRNRANAVSGACPRRSSPTAAAGLGLRVNRSKETTVARSPRGDDLARAPPREIPGRPCPATPAHFSHAGPGLGIVLSLGAGRLCGSSTCSAYCLEGSRTHGGREGRLAQRFVSIAPGAIPGRIGDRQRAANV